MSEPGQVRPRVTVRRGSHADRQLSGVGGGASSFGERIVRDERELLQIPYLARVRENVERLERGLPPLPMPKEQGPAPPPGPSAPRARTRPPEPEPASCTRCSKVALLKAGLCGGCYWGELEPARLIDDPKEVRRARVVREAEDQDEDLEQQLRGLEVAVDEAPAEIAPAPQQEVSVARTKCPVCDEEFERTHHKQVNCSRACTIKAADQRRKGRSREHKGGGVVAPRRERAKPRTAAPARPAPQATSLTAELEAMRAVAAAVEGLPTALAIEALTWVLERYQDRRDEAERVVDEELAERDGEEAA